MFRPSRWPRMRFTRSSRPSAWPLRWLAVGLFAVWVVGALPFLLLTPVGRPVVAMFEGWAVDPPTATVEPEAVAALEPTETPPEAATAEPAATSAPTATLATQRAHGAEASSVVDPSATEVAVPEDAGGGERFAFLLMGYGGGRHEGGFLTDSMVVVMVDPAKRTLTLLSIPRDAWVPMSFDGKTMLYNKANTAYAFGRDASLYPNRLAKYRGEKGAGVFASDTISRVIGVPIRYYLALDFAGFRQMIDAVGGVDVDVPRAFAARYPANDDPTVDSSWTTVRFRAGEQRLNGERAIQYARARDAIDDSGEGSDFARSRRQRLIMEAFKARLLQPTGLVALPRLATIASGHVDTNYDLPGVAQLTELTLDWKSVRFHQSALTLGNFLDEATGPDGAYVLVPSMDDHSWTQVRSFARRLWDDPEAGVVAGQTPITVVNASGTDGLAGRLSGALARLGYLVRAPASAPARPATRLLDSTGGKADPLARQLARDLGLELSASPGAESEGLVLEVGSADADLSDPPASREPAPYSIAGIAKFGAWLPAPDPEPEAPRLVVRATAAPGTPGPGTPASGTPGHGTPAAGTPGHGTPAAGTPGHGTPGAGTPAAGTPGAGTVGSGTPGAGAPTAGTPGALAPAAGAPAPAGTPGPGTPRAGSPPAPAATARPGTAPAGATPAGARPTGTAARAGTPPSAGGTARPTAPPVRGDARDGDEDDETPVTRPGRPPSGGFGAPGATPTPAPPSRPGRAAAPTRSAPGRLPATVTPVRRATAARA